VPLKKFTIDIEGRDDSTLTVLYNPEEYTVSKDNNFAVQGVPGRNSPVVQFVNGNQRTLEVELFCDTWDSSSPVKSDVRHQTRPITNLMRIDSELHAPPILIVTMASLRLRCVLSRVSEQYTMLMPDGMPVRARLTCSFLEVVDPEQDAKESNLQTSDFSKVHVVARGDTLSSIAASRYEDPGRWRPIALANDIANPLRIAVGQSLRIPALPILHPETGEAVD
jgi:LysM repeat protein